MSQELAMRLFESGSTKYRKIYRLWNSVTEEGMKGLHVHHRDHNHNFNHPENLELLTPDDHAKKHGFLSNFIMAHSTAIEKGSTS